MSALFGRKGANAFLIDLEFGDIEGRNADTGVEAYLVNRSVSGEYRDAGRSVD